MADTPIPDSAAGEPVDESSGVESLPSFCTDPEETHFKVFDETPVPDIPDTPVEPDSDAARSPCRHRSLPELKELAMRLGPLHGLEPDDYDCLLAELVADRRRLASTHSFRESSRLNEVIGHVSMCQLEDRKYRLQVDACHEYDEQATQFEQRLREYDAESVRLENELKARLARQRDRLLFVHGNEMKCFVVKWSSDPKRRQYNRASQNLRFLRRQLRLYMLQCRFTEAEEVKNMLIRTEEAEQTDAANQLQHDFDDAHAKLQRKQAGEVALFDDAAKIQITQLQQRRTLRRQLFVNEKRKFDHRADQIADPERLWNLHQMQRMEEIAKGGQPKAQVCVTRLAEDDLPDRDDGTIQLPPLRIPPTPKTSR
jgi:hypothetical protein